MSRTIVQLSDPTIQISDQITFITIEFNISLKGHLSRIQTPLFRSPHKLDLTEHNDPIQPPRHFQTNRGLILKGHLSSFRVPLDIQGLKQFSFDLKTKESFLVQHFKIYFFNILNLFSFSHACHHMLTHTHSHISLIRTFLFRHLKPYPINYCEH